VVNYPFPFVMNSNLYSTWELSIDPCSRKLQVEIRIVVGIRRSNRCMIWSKSNLLLSNKHLVSYEQSLWWQIISFCKSLKMPNNYLPTTKSDRFQRNTHNQLNDVRYLIQVTRNWRILLTSHSRFRKYSVKVT